MQRRDFLALTGDSIDNVPGVDKCGPKTAAKWIATYEGLENIVRRAAEIPGKAGESLRERIEDVRRNRELNELSRDFQRKQREFREDLNLRQNEENAAIIEKANKAIKQLAETEKFDLIVQDVVWASPKLDITEKIIKALAAESK